MNLQDFIKLERGDIVQGRNSTTYVVTDRKSVV